LPGLPANVIAEPEGDIFTIRWFTVSDMYKSPFDAITILLGLDKLGKELSVNIVSKSVIFPVESILFNIGEESLFSVYINPSFPIIIPEVDALLAKTLTETSGVGVILNK
jgi:hypothetical protein